jgi:tRNA threonylcarbamoyl adenosine modification protein (Sua5/YciO/YrdC/YwlC family)
MASLYELNPDDPQVRSIEEITRELKKGAIMLYPTDTVYAIGCDMNVKSAVERVRELKNLSNQKPLTFLCSSLSNISKYAVVHDEAYYIMKRLIPGPYTFVLPTTKLVPKLVMSPKRKTTGIRVPQHNVCQALLKSLNNPLISTSAYTIDEEGESLAYDWEKAKLFDSLEKRVDIIIDDQTELGYQVSTIIDFSIIPPVIVRQGLGWEKLEQWFDFE